MELKDGHVSLFLIAENQVLNPGFPPRSDPQRATSNQQQGPDKGRYEKRSKENTAG
jgi:hypothetical protein